MAPNIRPKRSGKRAELASWLERTGTARIGEPEFAALSEALAPISENYLRRLLRGSGVALAPVVEGVRQGTFDELEASLLALLEEYEAGDAVRKSAVRRLVVVAKDHARWAARRAEKHVEKEEMALWMLTWLENPPVFPAWVKLRRREAPDLRTSVPG